MMSTAFMKAMGFIIAPSVIMGIYAHHEVRIKQSCPVCKKEIDWERVFLEARSRFAWQSLFIVQ